MLVQYAIQRIRTTAGCDCGLNGDFVTRLVRLPVLVVYPKGAAYGDAEEMDLDHIQRRQSLTDAMDNVSNRGT